MEDDYQSGKVPRPATRGGFDEDKYYEQLVEEGPKDTEGDVAPKE